MKREKWRVKVLYEVTLHALYKRSTEVYTQTIDLSVSYNR